MNNLRKKIKQENGQALVTALIFMLALTFMGFGLITMSTIDVKQSRNMRLGEEALAAAEQGLFMGLAWAAHPDTLFTTLAKGDTVRLQSTTNAGRSNAEKSQYEVVLTMGGLTEGPVGESLGKSGAMSSKIIFVQVTVEALGMVSEAPKGIFDFTARPQIKRTIEVVARVRQES